MAAIAEASREEGKERENREVCGDTNSLTMIGVTWQLQCKSLYCVIIEL